MVEEVRRIKLSHLEIIAAFNSHRRMAPHFLPGGKIIECRPQNSGNLSLLIDLQIGSDTLQSEITLKNKDLLMPIVRYCLENNIMLPKAGKKSIHVQNGFLFLEIELNTDLEKDIDLSTPLNLEHMINLNSAS